MFNVLMFSVKIAICVLQYQPLTLDLAHFSLSVFRFSLKLRLISDANIENIS
jgi:hypothetical protein